MPLYSKDDFTGCLQLAAERRCARRQWGRWRLEGEHLDYVREDGRVWFWLDLVTIQDAPSVMRALAEVRHKSWARPTDIADVVAALDDVFDLRAFASGASIDTGAHLRWRRGEMEGER